jgi:ferric-chelate reductase
VTEFLSGTKEQRGIGALIFLLLIASSSAGPLRRYSYPAFFILHYVGVIGFLVLVNRHTVYARNWATYAVVGIYGLDIIGRLAGVRVRYVEVEAMEGGMVRVGMRGLHGGWRYVLRF